MYRTLYYRYSAQNKWAELEKMLYDGAVKFDGDGDYLSVSTSSDFDFGTGAYTLEFWVNSGRESGENGLFSTMTSSDYGIGIWHNGATLYFEERHCFHGRYFKF